MDYRRILIATGNPHKVEEIQAIFQRERLGSIQLQSLKQAGFGNLPEPDEVGDTFEANAAIKATAYAAATGMLCLADDSGLEVDALNGRPGVISSHYFNDGRTDGPATGMPRETRDSLNNQRLLRELDGIEPARRTARFVCVMALAGPSLLHTTRGTFEGRIGLPGQVPRGANGFGYDPLFLTAPDFTQTGAELSEAEKNARSHRNAAAVQMATWLRDRA